MTKHNLLITGKGGVKADIFISELKLPILFFLSILFSMTFVLASLPQVVVTPASSSPGGCAIGVNADNQIFKQYDLIDLKIQCINNGTFCSASANCNVTITYPNGSLLTNNLPMTNQISFHNISIPSSSTLGDYLCSATCCDGSNCATDSNCDFRITTTGKENWNTLPLFLLLGGFIVFGFASYLKNEYIGLLSGFLFIVAGVYMMIFGLGLFQDIYTQTISYVAIGMGLMVCFIAVIEMFYTDLGIMGDGNDD